MWWTRSVGFEGVGANRWNVDRQSLNYGTSSGHLGVMISCSLAHGPHDSPFCIQNTLLLCILSYITYFPTFYSASKNS
jgi:hypothetical protein